MRWIGLTERVSIYARMLWLAVLSLSLLPTRVQIVALSDDARTTSATDSKIPQRRRNRAVRNVA